MNCLAFNPNTKIIEQWKQIYFTETIMDSFETIIDKTHMYLQVIKNYKKKKQKQKRKLLRSRPSLCEDLNQDPTVAQAQDITHQAYSKIIEEWISGINTLKTKLAEETGKQQLSKNTEKKSQEKEEVLGKLEVDSKLAICETNLQQITVQSIRFYNNFLSQQFRIIQDFIRMKIAEIQAKFGKMQRYLKSVNLKEIDPIAVRTIYENIYIESEYIRKVVEQTKNTFKRHSSEKQYSSQYYEINQVREKYTSKIDAMQGSILQIKENLRLVYFQYFKKKKTMKIRDHDKLEKLICDQVAVNKQEYEQTTSNANFINGFIASFLFCMLVAIIIFRQVNLTTLQSDDNYLRDFKIWRGASYLICFNWVVGIVLYFFDKYKINYRMILIQEDTFLPKYTTFFLTASVLSAIYLTLFLVYVLFKLNIISNHGGIENMGYYMWIINITFLLNPFKVLNYQGRKYFLKLIYKFLMTLFCPMNMNIFFVAILIASFVQPFSDFAFTFCTAVYSGQTNKRDCQLQTKNATFIFTLTYLFYRCVQSIRSHIQFGDKCYSRPLIGITAVLFAANTVLSSYYYNISLSNQLLAYWLASASMSTIAGIQADLRADWGLISFDKEDWILRKYKLFERKVYYIVTVIDVILNIGWILTISNDLSSNIGLSPVYFLMILAYIELARKGLWIFFRIQDDHSANIGNLRALIDDTHLYAQIQLQDKKLHYQINNSEIHSIGFAQIQLNFRTNNKSINEDTVQNQNIEKSKPVKKLSDIQEMIINKKISIASLKVLISQLQDYLSTIHQIYQQFQWEDQY